MFRSYEVNDEINQTEYTVDRPAGVVDGDIVGFGVVTYNVQTINLPAGMTDISGQRDIGTDASMRVFCKIASSEPAAYTFTDILDVAGSGHIIAFAYSGRDGTTPLDGITPLWLQSGFTASPATDALTAATGPCRCRRIVPAATSRPGTAPGPPSTGHPFHSVHPSAVAPVCAEQAAQMSLRRCAPCER